MESFLSILNKQWQDSIKALGWIMVSCSVALIWTISTYDLETGYNGSPGVYAVAVIMMAPMAMFIVDLVVASVIYHLRYCRK